MKLLLNISFVFAWLACFSQMDTTISLISKIDYFPQFELHDNNKIRMMGYSSTIGGAINIPSPTISLVEGDSVQLSMWNLSQGPPHTIHLHGVDVNQANDGVPALSFSIEHDETGHYFFEAPHPGTYLYHCHEASVLHVQAGMYGMLIVRPASSDTLTWEGGYSFHKEGAWLMSEIDTNWHTNEVINHPHDPSVTTHLIQDYKPQHYLVNGKSEHQLDVSSMRISGSVGEKFYLRLANVGYYGNHVDFPAELNATIISSDGRPLPVAETSNSVEVLPGERYGVMLDFSQEMEDSISIQFFDLNTNEIADTQFVDLSVNGYLGIDDEIFLDPVVYPNPVTEKIMIQLSDQHLGESAKISISDVLGELVKEVRTEGLESNSIQINVEDFQEGIYFITIDLVDRQYSKKIIIVK